MDQHQQTAWHPKSSLTVETSHWTSNSLESSSILHTLIYKWNAKFTFICKEDFGPLSTWLNSLLSSVFFSLAQVRCFWCCFCFRSGLVALFLKMSERGDSWCTDYSFSSSECFNLLCVTVFSSLLSSLLLVHLFLPKCFLPVNFAFNMLWYNTLWTATPFSNDLLWHPLCGGCQWLSPGPLPNQQCSPLLWFQRTSDTPDLHCRDGHLMILKCKYKKILRYWIVDFHEL